MGDEKAACGPGGGDAAEASSTSSLYLTVVQGMGPHGYKGQWLKQSRSLEVLTIKILNGNGEFEDKKNIFERLKI